MSKPSVAALRTVIALNKGQLLSSSGAIEDLKRRDIKAACIIDQETRLPDLVEALHGVYALFGHLLTENSPPETNAEIIKERRERLKILLYKAGGREGP